MRVAPARPLARVGAADSLTCGGSALADYCFVVRGEPLDQLSPDQALALSAPVFVVPRRALAKKLQLTVTEPNQTRHIITATPIGALQNAAAALTWLTQLVAPVLAASHERRANAQAPPGYAETHRLVVHIDNQAGFFAFLKQKKRCVVAAAKMALATSAGFKTVDAYVIVQPSQPEMGLHFLNIYARQLPQPHSQPNAVRRAAVGCARQGLAHTRVCVCAREQPGAPAPAPVLPLPTVPASMDSALDSAPQQARLSEPAGAVTYNFLRSFRGVHKTRFYALAELFDNAKDSNATTMHVSSTPAQVGTALASLTLVDNGAGMSVASVRHLLNSLGFSTKVKQTEAIGGFGQGFMKAMAQLTRFAVVLSRLKSPPTAAAAPVACGLFAYPEHLETSRTTLNNQTFAWDDTKRTLIAAGVPDIDDAMARVAAAYALLERQGHGTALVLLQLLPGLSYNAATHDVVLGIPDARHITSLRQFCKWIYLRPSMQVSVDGEDMKMIDCRTLLVNPLTATDRKVLTAEGAPK
jgi:hypothetical protein